MTDPNGWSQEDLENGSEEELRKVMDTMTPKEVWNQFKKDFTQEVQRPETREKLIATAREIYQRALKGDIGDEYESVGNMAAVLERIHLPAIHAHLLPHEIICDLDYSVLDPSKTSGEIRRSLQTLRQRDSGPSEGRGR